MGIVNTVGDFIRSVFPTIINKSGVIFKALLSDKENNNGTIESIFNDVELTRKEWTINKDVYEQCGEQLQRSLKVFSVLTKLQDENESTFIKRNKLLYVRNSKKSWSNKWDILNIFKTFFSNENVYIVNNTEPFKNNLLEDGNFERQDSWILEDATYEREARFEETTGVLFNASGTCTQTVNVDIDSVYFLHFFLKGNIRVQIQDNNGRFWNSKGGNDNIGSWGNVENTSFFENKEWNNCSLYFITDASISNATIKFMYSNGNYAFLDYVRLNKKDSSSTFSLIAVFESSYSEETGNLAPGTNDDIIEHDYSTMGFYSPGEKDVKEIAYEKLSYLDDSFLKENESPIVTEDKDDIEPLSGYDNMTYADEKMALSPNSPVNSDDFKSVNYNKVTYFDNAYIFGATGTEAEEIYQELLDIVQAGGVTSTIEILTREQDDN